MRAQKWLLFVRGLFGTQKSHPCHRRDDFFVRNGLPVAVRSTFFKVVSVARFWPLQIVALLAVAWTILHLPKLASQKCAWHGRKTYIFKKVLMSPTSKNFTFILWGAKSACGATPVPTFRPPAPDRSLQRRSCSFTTLASSVKPHSSIRVIFTLLSKITFGHLLHV